MTGFLILHYKTIRETIACVDSIRGLEDAGGYHILIADNGSADGTYEELSARYADDGDVTVMTTGKNLGFSAGNNAGWAVFPGRDALDALVVCNSDVVFAQKDFLVRLAAQPDYDILGPDIRVPKKRRILHTSPLAPIRLYRRSVQNSLAIHRKRIDAVEMQPSSGFFSRLHYPNFRLFLWHCRYSLSIRIFQLKNQLHNAPAENVLLQGACMIFSRRYLQQYAKLFDPETFFYYEELLLWVKAQRDSLAIRYDPSLYVLHLEGVSTHKSQLQQMQRFIFVQGNLLNSEKVVLQYASHFLK